MSNIKILSSPSYNIDIVKEKLRLLEDKKRFELWIRNNRQDSEGVKECKEWLDKTEKQLKEISQISALRNKIVNVNGNKRAQVIEDIKRQWAEYQSKWKEH